MKKWATSLTYIKEIITSKHDQVQSLDSLIQIKVGMEAMVLK